MVLIDFGSSVLSERENSYLFRFLGLFKLHFSYDSFHLFNYSLLSFIAADSFILKLEIFQKNRWLILMLKLVEKLKTFTEIMHRKAQSLSLIICAKR